MIPPTRAPVLHYRCKRRILWMLTPRHRLASLRRRIVNIFLTASMRSHRDRMMLIGAEGITAKGSYTWGNFVALRLRPRKIDFQLAFASNNNIERIFPIIHTKCHSITKSKTPPLSDKACAPSLPRNSANLMVSTPTLPSISKSARSILTFKNPTN